MTPLGAVPSQPDPRTGFPVEMPGSPRASDRSLRISCPGFPLGMSGSGIRKSCSWVTQRTQTSRWPVLLSARFKERPSGRETPVSR